MNLDHINKIWSRFSAVKQTELKHKERTINNAIQSNYLINYTDELATFTFIGMLSKSSQGHITDKTSIIVEFNNRLNIQNFEIHKTNEINSEFERRLLNQLDKFNGHNITLKDEFIRIDTEHIFSSIDEFEQVTDLIFTLKKD